MIRKHLKPSVYVESDYVDAGKVQPKVLSQSGTHKSDNHVPFAVEVESFNITPKTPEKTEETHKTPKPVKKKSISKQSPRNRLPHIDVDNLECSDDGVPMLPIKLECYEGINISDDEMKNLQKAGRRSYRRGADGTTAECVVVKTKESFAIPIKVECEPEPVLQWTMDRIDLVKKVRGSDGLVYVDIKVADELGEKVIRVPGTAFDEKGITKVLAKYNISIYAEHAMPMSVYFKRLLKEMPMEEASTMLGVVKKPATNEVEFNGYGANGIFKTKSKYQTFKEYLKHFNPLLEQSKPLQYLLAATMAAPVLAVLQQKYSYDLHSYCINMVGASSTGKTICSRVCASAWTNPTDEMIFSAMNSTHNSAIQRLSGRYGVPTFYDEATNGGDVRADKYAYSIYNGRDKERLNRDGSKKASGTWSTIVCMSSEQHFHDNAKNQNGGLANRVHSMENLAWTASKQHAEALNDFIRDNYGVLGKVFTKHLFKEDKLSEIEDRYAKARETMNAYCKNHYGAFTDRLCQTYALTYMTAVMLKKMGLTIDVKAVAHIMTAHNKVVSEEQNLAKNAFKAIVSHVACIGKLSGSGIRTYTDTKVGIVKVAIVDSLMDKIMANSGIKDTKVAMKELADAGYLIRQDKRGLKSKLTIGGTLCWCYQISFTSLLNDPDYNLEDRKEFLVTQNDTMLTSIFDDEELVTYDPDEDKEKCITDEEEAESEEEDADSDLAFSFDKSKEEDADPELTFSFDKFAEEDNYDMSCDVEESEEDEADSCSIFFSTELDEDDEYAEDEEDEYVEIDWDAIPVHSHSQWGFDRYGYNNDDEDDDEDEYSDYE